MSILPQTKQRINQKLQCVMDRNFKLADKNALKVLCLKRKRKKKKTEQ